MPWPIPTLAESRRPDPMRARAWIAIFIATLAAGMGVVLLLWPSGKPTNTVEFWIFLVGGPIGLFALAFGFRLDQWEREQQAFDETERERARIDLLWRDWSRRHLSVVQAGAFVPVDMTVADLASADAKLPVNLQRSIGFTWPVGNTSAERRAALLSLVCDRLAEVLGTLRAIKTVLILDNAALADGPAWIEDVRSALGAAVPGLRIETEVPTSVACADWIEANIDLDCATPRLIIAAQLWRDDGLKAWSEGAAAMLFPAVVVSPHKAASKVDIPSSRIYRSMTSADLTVSTDVTEMIDAQVAPKTASRAWLTGCDKNITRAVLTALRPKIKERPVACDLDHVLGRPGPVSSWIALAIALEISEIHSDSQFVIWGDTVNDTGRTRSCVVAPSFLGKN